MKCKVCGTQNPDYMEYCENCAALLDDSAAGPAPAAAQGDGAWGFARAPQWPQPDFNANTITEEEIPTEYVRRYEEPTAEPAAEPAPVAERQDEELEYQAPRPRTRVSKVTPQPRFEDDAYDDEDDYEDERPVVKPARRAATAVNDNRFYDSDRHKRPAKRRAGSKKRNKTLLFYGAAGLLVIIIAVLLVIFLTRGDNDEPPAASAAASDTQMQSESEPENVESAQLKPAFLGGLFSKSPITKPATIEKDPDGAETAYIVTLYTKSNCSYRFTAGTLVNEGAINGRSVSLRIPEQVLMPTEPVDGEIFEVTPDIVVINKDGEETRVEFAEPIKISLPTLILTLTNPLETDFSVSVPGLDITGSVDNNTAEVYVNDMQLPVDGSGSFAGTYTLPGVGNQVVNVEARKNGYAIARTTLNVEYATDVAAGGADPSSAGAATDTGTPAFTFAADQARRTTSAALKVAGTLESGATLSVEGVTLNGQVTTNASAGTFEFTVDMPEVGLYTAVVSSNNGGVAGSRTIYLERSHADANAYMEGCHALDYQYLKDSPYHKQGYLVSGKVVEVLQSSPFVIARITTDSGDIIFHYHNTAATVEANDGKTYKVYADPNGRYEADSNVPVVYAWYIKKSG